MRGVDAVAKLPYVDSTRIGAAGGSFGGHMVNWINGHTSRFKVLVAHDGDFNLSSMYAATEELWFPEHDLGGPPWVDRTDYERWSPDRFAARMRTPELVVHGGQDFRVPEGEGFQAFTALQRQGVPSQLLYFPDEGTGSGSRRTRWSGGRRSTSGWRAISIPEAPRRQTLGPTRDEVVAPPATPPPVPGGHAQP